MKFTNEQLITLVSDRNQIVIANAGSGKTTILVEKYLELIKSMSPLELQKIVAITFTKKAAAEMKERVINRLNSEIEDLKNKELPLNTFLNEYQTLMEYREQISGAKIQTIHSFCQDILKEHAIEIGLNPYFNLLEENLLEELKDNFFYETLEEFLVDERKKKHNADKFFEYMDRKKLNEIIMLLFQNPSATISFKRKFENISLDAYENEVISVLIPFIIKKHQYLVDEIKDIHANSADDEKTLNGLKQFMNLIDVGFPELHSDYFLDDIEQYEKFWDLIKNEKVKGSKKLKGYSKNSDKFSKNVEFLLKVSSLSHLSTYFDLNKFIYNFYVCFENKIENYKLENSFITYNDMLIKTYNLLHNETITEKIRKKFKYLLIDEFQDTDDIQYSIVKKIIPSISNPSDLNSSKLFIVGDPKQSIYGFRNSDVRVMKKAENEIMSTNSTLKSQALIKSQVEFNHKHMGLNHLSFTNEETLGKIELKISHRLNIVNTLFVNDLFEKLLQENSSEYSVDYNSFIYARESPYLTDLKDDIRISSDILTDEKFGAVKFLFNVDRSNLKQKVELIDEKESSENFDEISEDGTNGEESSELTLDNENEAKLVSKYIKSIISKEIQIYDSNIGIRRKINYSDIGVLVRKRNGVDKLLKQMDQLEIPYFINDSKNFFQTQEIIDIISFLKFLYDINDNLAFASVLKSNFFGFSDSELLEIRKSSDSGSLWEAFLNFCTEKNEYKYQRAFDILSYFVEYINQIPLKILINELIEKTNFIQSFALSSSREAIEENIKCFINFVKKTSSRGISTFTDFINEINKSYVNNMHSDEVMVSEENAVNILTIHKSKGLEFPVVILYNLNSEGKKNNSVFLDDVFGLSFKFKNFDNLKSDNLISIPLYELSKDLNDQKEEEEAKRILYVATTRAKDILILSATLKLNSDKNGKIKFKSKTGLFKLLIDGLSLNDNNLLDIFDNNLFYRNNLLTTYNEDNYQSFNINYQIPVLTKIEDFEKLDLSAPIQEKVNFLLDKVIANPPINTNSATKLLNFLKKPGNYVENYLIHFPESLKSLQISNQSENITGAERGILIHKAFSEIHLWLNQDKPDKDILKEILLRETLSQELNSNEEAMSQIIDEIFSVVNAKFIMNHKNELISSEKEIEMDMPFGNDFIKIIIDALVRMSDGTYEIWDWKSNLVNDSEKLAELTEFYSFQLKYYAFVVKYLYTEQEKFVCRLFFTRLAAEASKDSDWIATFEWSRAELEEFSKEIENYFERMHNPQEMYKYIIENL